MSFKRKQISITEEDYDLIDYIKKESSGNDSKFIWKCVRYYKDNNKKFSEEDIKKLIEKYMKDGKIR